ncbi:alpha/beta-hydrolase [Jaminaea rosea]|uniref:Alpha/beta-hydrolase n=1 Tax=Jaminaea rosea TaxID=1569628 RepID=A0A316UVN4_9BASI|nr:alpha/beta-hydrolase [Jaminaea rosea]PWN27185.1 alpha/beta-hydrolase [Jaminaea rosea]
MPLSRLFVTAGLAASFLARNAVAAAVPPPSTECTSYSIITTRGSLEEQGPSEPFIPLNKFITKALKPEGKEHDTVYAASWYQNSNAGTGDIIKQVSEAEPGHCFILEGYSQGATATVNALQHLNDHYDRILGVILFGNPCRSQGTPMLPATPQEDHKMPFWMSKDSPGILVGTLLCPTLDGVVPKNWRSKVMDICQPGDAMCARGWAWVNGLVTDEHAGYGTNENAQRKAFDFATGVVRTALAVKAAKTNKTGYELVSVKKGGDGHAQQNGEAKAAKDAKAKELKGRPQQTKPQQTKPQQTKPQQSDEDHPRTGKQSKSSDQNDSIKKGAKEQKKDDRKGRKKGEDSSPAKQQREQGMTRKGSQRHS